MRAMLKDGQGGRIARPRLASRIGEALESGGVLVTAGAGYGKTTVLEQALSARSMLAAWIGCTETERAPETLLKRILDATARAAPGSSEALIEHLATAPEQVDALAATREWLVELPRLLVEPISLVIDDAEHLEGAEQSLRLISELFRAELPSLRLAVASRRSLDLRVAKPRATGRLLELTAADLAFEVEECEALMRTGGNRDPSPRQVEAVMEATEGWPLGIAFAVQTVDRMLRGAGEQHKLRDLRSAPDLRAFLAEELLDSLEPKLHEGAIESSVARVVTPEVARTLKLPPEFARRIEAAGMMVRQIGDEGTFAYHPLLRELLLERLGAERGEEERRRLHRAVAPAIATMGDAIGAIEHWLEAEAWAEAVAAIEQEGPVLVRTSAGLMRRWLDLLPDEARALPRIRSLEGQLEWGAGDHPRAIEALRDAIRGFRLHPDPPNDWMARFVLADSLFGIGEYEQTLELIEGWDEPAAAPAGVLAPATVIYVAVNLAAVGRLEDSDRLAAAANRHPDAAMFAPIEAIRLAFHDVPRGHLDEAFACMDAAAIELERFDPFNRRLYVLATMAIMLADHGRPEESLGMWMQVREGASGGAGPFLVDTTHAWSALLLAQEGRLREAEAELSPYAGQERGWRVHIGDLAAACVSSLRGDAAATVSHAERALAAIEGGPILFRYWTAADLVTALAEVGKVDRAVELLDETLALVDAVFPGPSGCFPRGRLLAQRAWLRSTGGDLDGADGDLRRFWKEADQSLPHTLRREWVRLKEPVWAALERGSLEPEGTIGAIGKAFPEGLPLVAFLGHPVAAVRRAALDPATQSGDPAALERLRQLADDPDPDLAEAAARALERLVRTLPPLRFELLGTFGVGRGAWRVGDAWGRPVDARLVRFLLVNLDQPVPEDLIFEALWPELEASKARNSLQVALSRTRRVLDPPGAERSVIESAGRSYRLALGERDLVDAEEFRSAATAALGEHGGEQRRLLERARSLWGSAPMPEDRYSDWAAGYRERLIDLYTGVLGGLAEIHETAGEHAAAADVARELVDLDPLNEGGHRALIAAYARAGRTGNALRQYLECRRALVDQLGIEPTEETSRLQARILAGESI